MTQPDGYYISWLVSAFTRDTGIQYSDDTNQLDHCLLIDIRRVGAMRRWRASASSSTRSGYKWISPMVRSLSSSRHQVATPPPPKSSVFIATSVAEPGHFGWSQFEGSGSGWDSGIQIRIKWYGFEFNKNYWKLKIWLFFQCFRSARIRIKMPKKPRKYTRYRFIRWIQVY